MTIIESSAIPKEVRSVALTLQSAGFSAYLVGGAVRDYILSRKPVDFDITTDATPEEIISLFPKTFYENSFGTVGVVTCGEEMGIVCDEVEVQVVEVTPYRKEAEYLDGRHPSSVSFSNELREDLVRRDFTINAMAYDISTSLLVDMYEGVRDIHNKLIRAVGNPYERFTEDYLRVMRAVRFATVLGYEIEKETESALIASVHGMSRVSSERIRDEFVKILMSDNPKRGIELLHKYNLLRFVVPELESGIDIQQNQAHSFDVWEHNLRTLQHSADKGWPLHVRLAAMLHDISKPETRRFSDEKKDYTFYGHEVVGSKTSKQILTRLKFDRETINSVVSLVRWHMFFSDTEQITLSAVRRMIRNVGEGYIWDLMNLRICDRVGTGRPKEEPYRFRKYQSMIEEALRDPITPKMLKVNGDSLIANLGLVPGPILGSILHILLEEVIDDPAKNTIEYLEGRAKELAGMPQDILKSIADSAKEKVTEADQTEQKKIRRKFHIA